MNADNLPNAVTRLFDLLSNRNIEHLLVGGVAMLHYVQGRNTQDIDLIIAEPALQRLPELYIADRNPDFARGNLDDLQFDFRFTNNPLFDKVQKQYATTHTFAEQTIPCATVEGLLLLKMYALPSLYRQLDGTRIGLYENDIFTLLYNYRPDIQPLVTELAHYVSQSDLREIHHILGDLQHRIERINPPNLSQPDPSMPDL